MDEYTQIKTFTLLAMANALSCDACPVREECDEKYGMCEDGEGATPQQCVDLWVNAND